MRPNMIPIMLPVWGQGGGVVSPPAQPTGLTATPSSVTQIDLAWTDNATNETAYKVYRSTNGVDYSQVGTDQAADANSYSDTTITSGTTYYYKVAAVNAGGETLSDAATANTLTYGLGAYFKLDEASGNRVSSVGSFTATETGTMEVESGKVGLAAGNSGGANRLNVSDNAVFSVGANGICFAFWMRFDATGGNYTAVSKMGAAGDDEYTIDYGSAGRFRFFAYGADDSGPTIGTANTFGAGSTGTFYFILAWYDPADKKLYISVNNGTADASAAIAPGIHGSGGQDFVIGSSYTGAAYTNNLNGFVDEIAVYNRLLTSDEKAALYNSGSGVTYPF